MLKKYSDIGIRCIEYAETEQNVTFCELAIETAKKLFQENEICEEEIGVLIYATEYPEYLTPSTSFVIHKELQMAKDCFQYDINQGSVGFLRGLEMVATLMRGGGNGKKALLICSDYANKNDRKKTVAVTILSYQKDSLMYSLDITLSQQYDYLIREHSGECRKEKSQYKESLEQKYQECKNNFENELKNMGIEFGKEIQGSLSDSMTYIAKKMCEENIKENVKLSAIGVGIAITNLCIVTSK